MCNHLVRRAFCGLGCHEERFSAENKSVWEMWAREASRLASFFFGGWDKKLHQGRKRILLCSLGLDAWAKIRVKLRRKKVILVKYLTYLHVKWELMIVKHFNFSTILP